MRGRRNSTRSRTTGWSMSNWKIPLTDLDYGDEELHAVQRVLRSQWLSMGPEVAAFEREFAGHCQIPHAVAVSSATAALSMALAVADVGAQDEVIQPGLNFVAAANATVQRGAEPVFVDVLGLDEPTLDPRQVARRIGPRTKAVVAMHYGGRLCRMAELAELCERHGVVLIEDACHAVGVSTEAADGGDSFAGGIGDLGAFSFFSNKNLATGEGGMVVTRRDDFAERLRPLRSHGMTTLTWDRHRGHASSYDVAVHGSNYRLDELHAALGRVQLQKLADNNRRRRTVLDFYAARLGGLEGWMFPLTTDQPTSGHLMVAVAPDGAVRDRVVADLRQAGVQTSLHYPCIADFTAFQDWQAAELAMTRDFAQRAISLPIFPTMTEQQVDYVCEALLATPASEGNGN